MPRLVLHNLSIPYHDALPALHSFDQNGIFFAAPYDVVVMRTAPPDPAWLTYLTQEGIIAAPLNFLVSTAPPDTFSIFTDAQCLAQLKSIVNKDWELDVFMPSQAEATLAQTLGITYKSAVNQYEAWSSKSRFRTIAKALSVPIARGFEHCTTSWSLYWAVLRLFMRGTAEVVIKHDDGVAGLSSRRLTRSAFFRSLLNRMSIRPPVGIAFDEPSYIVEAWHQTTASPSIQCQIAPDKTVTVISLHNQLMKGNGMSYVGCQSVHWLDKAVAEKLTSEAKCLCQHLAEEGYVGHLAFNAIVTIDGELLFTELNPRRVISSYAHRIACQVSQSEDEIQPYITYELERPDWRGLSPADLLEKLSPILYTNEKQSGVIPIDLKLLAHGYVILMAIAPTTLEAQNYLEHGKSIART